MIALLDTSHCLKQCEVELGVPVGQLLTPRQRRTLIDPDAPWGIDNSAFSQFDRKQFEALLSREDHHKGKCKFVSVPDVVGSARRTLEIFDHWAPLLDGWPVALVAQDGQEDLPIPWGKISAVFIGGSTKWKLSTHVTHIIQAAKIMEKWVHVGRINTRERYEHFRDLGADSFDGTGIAQYSHMRLAFQTIQEAFL